MNVRFATGIEVLTEHTLMKKIEAALIKKKIETVASFLPDEILKMDKADLEEMQHYVGVLLSADLSGFTNLTEKYTNSGSGGIYQLTTVLNAYIGAIVQVLDFYGGDMLFFSGESFLSVWKVGTDDSLCQILNLVVICALVIQQTLSMFSTGPSSSGLNLQMGISCGNIMFHITGDATQKRFVAISNAFDDARHAVQFGLAGDIVVSYEAWSHMLKERYNFDPASNNYVKIRDVLYKPNEVHLKARFANKQINVVNLIKLHINHKNMINEKKTYESNISDSKITDMFLRSLPPRAQIKFAPKHWSLDDLKPFILNNVKAQIDESQPVEYLTEMREITIQKIKIRLISVSTYTQTEIIDIIFKDVSYLVGKLAGVIDKITLEGDKLFMMILFGLRSQKHEMECRHAIISANQIKIKLSSILAVSNVTVVITSGFLYCGVIGHPMRRDFTMLGVAIQKAEQLIHIVENKIICDQKTFRYSNLSSYYFQLQKPVKLKGLEDVGYLFEFNEEPQEHKPDLLSKLIGRQHECNIIKAIISKSDASRDIYGVILYGCLGIGKSAIITNIMDDYRNLKSYEIAYIKLMENTSIPYLCVSKLYRQLYDEKAKLSSNQIALIKNLPRDLYNHIDEIENKGEDNIVRKYRILNYFRDLIRFTKNLPVLIAIENIDLIDVQSWEILKVIISTGNINLIMSSISKNASKIMSEIFDMQCIEKIEINPLNPKYFPILICDILDVAGIPSKLSNILINSCNGVVGYLKCCLLRMANHGSIEFLITSNKELNGYIFPYSKYSNIKYVPIVVYIDKFGADNLKLIILDLFDSFTLEQQSILKTASVLGTLFTRYVLMVAMKYPSERKLAILIQNLFDEEIFECGSTHIYERNKTCSCTCYFDENYLLDIEKYKIPKYAFCKLIHFKNHKIKKLAYNLLPSNQKIELHLLCTEVMESMTSTCPNCLRQPIINYIQIPKFKEVIHFCKDANIASTEGSDLTYSIGDLHDAVRKGIFDDTRRSIDRNRSSSRPAYNRNVCRCIEILCRVHVDLIHHSNEAKHLGKLIFFKMQYGLLLTLLYDYSNAINALTEARELCMTNANLPEAQISKSFRQYHVHTIEIGLASCCIDLRLLRAARNHLCIAFRQIQIPHMAFAYKIFNNLLTRTFLVNRRSMRPVFYGNNYFRRNIGLGLCVAAKLFRLEGNMKLAQSTIAHGIYILKTINVNFPVLYDAYCNAIEMFRYNDKMHICEKLQQFILKDFQNNYASGDSFVVYNINYLITEICVLTALSGDISHALRLGYRAFEINLNFHCPVNHTRLVRWLVMLLMFAFRICDVATIINKLKFYNQNSYNNLEQVTMLIDVYLRTGIEIEPITEIIYYAEHLAVHTSRASWTENLLIILVQVYYVRQGKFINADEWKQHTFFNSINVKREVVLKTLLYTIEYKLHIFLRDRRLNNSYVELEERNIIQLLKLAKKQVNTQYHIFKPIYLSLNAWHQKLMGNDGTANKLLKQALAVCEKHGNVLYSVFVNKLKFNWNNPYRFANVRKESSFNYRRLHRYTLREWSEFFTSFPLE